MSADRIRLIAHNSKVILLVDVSHCSPEEVQKISALLPKFVTQEPKESVLLLADFTGTKIDRATAERLKQDMVFDRPHLKRSAWVGTEGIPHALFENLKTFSQRSIPTFATREEALAYLTDDTEHPDA
jgi:hypothetical protein